MALLVIALKHLGDEDHPKKSPRFSVDQGLRGALASRLASR